MSDQDAQHQGIRAHIITDTSALLLSTEVTGSRALHWLKSLTLNLIDEPKVERLRLPHLPSVIGGQIGTHAKRVVVKW